VSAERLRPRGKRQPRWLLYGYCLYLALPIYWLATMALQSNQDIVGDMEVVPSRLTLANFAEIFGNPVWYSAFGHSLSYVVLNTLISVTVALPAAYAFSRYRFVGDRHLFFWLLTNRMAPPAVFLLPFFQLYSAIGLFDTPLAVALAHCLFTVPLAVWILEGFMSGVPRSLDEMARIDGHGLGYFFFRLFLPNIRGGIAVTVFFCFMFSWVELLLARTLTGSETKPIVVVMTRTVSASGLDWGVLAAAGLLTILPGVAVVWFVRRDLVKGFALGRV
jgi:glycerol transport system permease protein